MFCTTPSLYPTYVSSFYSSFLAVNSKRLGLTEHAVKNVLELHLVDLAHTGRRGGAHGSADISWSLLVAIDLTSSRHDARQAVAVRAHVLRFLLRKDDLSIGIPLDIAGNPIEREGGNLLNSYKSNIRATLLLAFGEELVVNLARAEDEGLNLIWIVPDIPVGLVDDALEHLAGAHVLERRNASLVTEEILGRHNNQRLAEITVYLPSEAMEVVGWSGAIDDLHVALLNLHAIIPCKFGDVMRIFIHLLQKALHTARRVLGSLAIEPVWQEHNETALTKPLVLSGHNELINHNLSTVDKVTELSLPKNEAVWILQTVSVLEAKDSKLRKDRVTGNESSLGIGT